MTSYPHASAKSRTTKRAVAKKLATRTMQIAEEGRPPVARPDALPAKPSSAKLLACVSRAKHKRLTEMLHDLRIRAEALSANADGLLSRLS